eukprot:2094632-Amphidinium_carterae.1
MVVSCPFSLAFVEVTMQRVLRALGNCVCFAQCGLWRAQDPNTSEVECAVEELAPNNANHLLEL